MIAIAHGKEPFTDLARTTGTDSTSWGSDRAILASPIACNRSFGSFSRQRFSNRRIAGAATGNLLQSGSVFRTDARVSEIVSPVKARTPDNISNITAPKAQMSARLSTV